MMATKIKMASKKKAIYLLQDITQNQDRSSRLKFHKIQEQSLCHMPIITAVSVVG